MSEQKTTSRHGFNANWPLPDDYLLELGRMVAVWAQLESFMVVAIGMLAGYESPTDARVLIMMAHNNSRQRLDVLETLCEQLVDQVAHVKDYKAVIKKIKSAQTGRNRYAHNAMSVDDKGEVHATVWSAHGTFKADVERVRVSDIREVTAKIHEAVCALQSLIGGGEIKPMWER